MIVNLSTKRMTATNIIRVFTHKMAAETSWQRYRTKLRHCHLTYKTMTVATNNGYYRIKNN